MRINVQFLGINTSGLIFQQFNLIETLSIYQNVELPLLYDGKLNKSERENIVKEKLEQVGLLVK